MVSSGHFPEMHPACGVEQAAEKRPNTVILSIDSLTAAHDRQKLGPKSKHADSTSRASWPSHDSVFHALQGLKIVAGGNAPGKGDLRLPTLEGSHSSGRGEA
jgi:hypothetical protein